MRANPLSDTDGPLSQNTRKLLQTVGEIAESEGMRPYLVGGAVRDSLLEKPIHDLDLCVEGHAPELANTIERNLGAIISMQSQFLTARIELDGTTIDISTCREESYSEPTVLPHVQPASIDHDLARRDFTINAMAIDISPQRWGTLLDPFNGTVDLKNRNIRSLHENSFADDPTRIFRALRYSLRLDFNISPSTMHDIERHGHYISQLSSDRLIAELRKICAEPRFNDIFTLAQTLGIMARIHPSFRWPTEQTIATNEALNNGLSQEDIFLATTGYFFPEHDQINALSDRITNSIRSRDLLLNAAAIKSLENYLTEPHLLASIIHRHLSIYQDYSLNAVKAVTNNDAFAQILSRELNEFRLVQTNLTARDLLEIGVPEGPAIGSLLGILLTNILDNPTTTREEEVTIVTEWMHNPSNNH